MRRYATANGLLDKISADHTGLHPPGKVSLERKKNTAFRFSLRAPLRTLAGYKRRFADLNREPDSPHKEGMRFSVNLLPDRLTPAYT
jgi:hypothetical protein